MGFGEWNVDAIKITNAFEKGQVCLFLFHPTPSSDGVCQHLPNNCNDFVSSPSSLCKGPSAVTAKREENYIKHKTIMDVASTMHISVLTGDEKLRESSANFLTFRKNQQKRKKGKHTQNASYFNNARRWRRWKQKSPKASLNDLNLFLSLLLLLFCVLSTKLWVLRNKFVIFQYTSLFNLPCLEYLYFLIPFRAHGVWSFCHAYCWFLNKRTSMLTFYLPSFIWVELSLFSHRHSFKPFSHPPSKALNLYSSQFS